MSKKRGVSENTRVLRGLLKTAQDMNRAGLLSEADLVQVEELCKAPGRRVGTGDMPFAEEFACMQNPVYKVLARLLERDVPEDAEFGRFQGKRDIK